MRCVIRKTWLAVCVCTAGATTEAWAADWSAKPWATMQAEYTDNIQLIPGYSNWIVGGVVNAGARVQRTDEFGYLRLSPSLRSTRIDSPEPLDSDDQLVDATWSRRGEHSQWRIDGNWTRDTTLTSELAISGLVQGRKRRVASYLAPSYTYILSPRHTLGAGVAYTKVNYKDAELTGLVDYDYTSANINWGYKWSEETTVSSLIFATRMKAKQVDNQLDSSGAQVRVSTQFSERWSGAFSIGGRHSEGSGLSTDGGNGWLAEARVNRKDELGSWEAAVSRTVDPSGVGTLVQRDQLVLTREHDLSPLWHIGVSAYLIENKDVQTLVASDRHYRNGVLRLSRILTPAWYVDLVYSYDWQKYAEQTEQAERNMFLLGVRYEPKSEFGEMAL